MIGLLRSLAADDRGTSVVEIALVAPILATLLVGAVDISRGFAARLQLEQAAQRSIEKVMQYQTTTSTFGTLKAEAASAAGVPEAQVKVKYWLECNGVSKFQSETTMEADYNVNCPSGQAYARYIRVTITKSYTPMFGTELFPGANSDGSITLTGAAGLRTQ